jgi:CheY-like chemotaxis protein
LREQATADFQWTVASTLDAALQKVQLEIFDVALLGLSLPDSRGLVTYERLHKAAPDLAVIALAQPDEEDLSMAAIRAGVQDYILITEKQRPLPLCGLIRNSIQRKAALRDIQQNILVDDATGFYNYRGFIEASKSQLRLARTAHQNLVLVRTHIDSHDIVATAPLIVDAVRRLAPVVCLGRIADDELGMLLPEIDESILKTAVSGTAHSHRSDLACAIDCIPVVTAAVSTIEPLLGPH